MKKRLGHILILFFVISIITGCSQGGVPGTKGGDQDEDFYKKGEMSSCCTPFCKDMIKSACDENGGVYTGLPCSEVDDCKIGCCLPFCQDTTKAECSTSIGYGGDWKDKACKDIEECQKVCCTPYYTLNTKSECEMLGGVAEGKEKCETEKTKGTLTLEINYDDSCSSGEPESSSTTTKNGITERFTATLMPDPNPVKASFIENYDNTRYLIGEGTYVMAGSGTRTVVSHGEYTCEMPPPAYDFKIPITVTSIERDDVTANVNGNVKMTIYEQDDGFHFTLYPDFFFKGNKIRTFVTTGEKKSCTDPDENSNTEEMDEDPPVEIDGSLPGAFIADSLKGTASWEIYSPTSVITCGKLAKGTITFDFEKLE